MMKQNMVISLKLSNFPLIRQIRLRAIFKSSTPENELHI